MAWSFKDSQHGHVANNTDDLLFTINTSAADLLCIGCGYYQGAGTIPTAYYTSDSSATGFVILTAGDSGDGNRHAFSVYVINPRQSATLGVTVHATGVNYLAGGCASFSGVDAYAGTQIHAAATVNPAEVHIADVSGFDTGVNDNMLLISVMGHDGDMPKVFDPSGGSTWETTGTNACLVAEKQTAGIDGNNVGGNMSYRILGTSTSGTKYGIKYDATGGRGSAGTAGISIFGFTMAGGPPPSATLKGLPLTGVGQ